MSFAVFGKNKVKAKDKAFKEIQAWERKKLFKISNYIAENSNHLSKYLEGYIVYDSCKDQYELALNEVFEELLETLKPTKISVLYDSPAPAIKYIEIMKGEDETLHIMQKVKCVDGDGEPVFTKGGKSQKTEWIKYKR